MKMKTKIPAWFWIVVDGGIGHRPDMPRTRKARKRIYQKKKFPHAYAHPWTHVYTCPYTGLHAYPYTLLHEGSHTCLCVRVSYAERTRLVHKAQATEDGRSLCARVTTVSACGCSGVKMPAESSLPVDERRSPIRPAHRTPLCSSRARHVPRMQHARLHECGVHVTKVACNVHGSMGMGAATFAALWLRRHLAHRAHRLCRRNDHLGVAVRVRARHA